MNRVFLIGNLTRDIDIQEKGDIKYLFNCVATRGFKKDETVFINFTAFGVTAELMDKFLHKGSKVALEGHVTVRTIEGEDGNKRDSIGVVADRIEFLDSKKDSDAPAKTDESNYEEDDDDEDWED